MPAIPAVKIAFVLLAAPYRSTKSVYDVTVPGPVPASTSVLAVKIVPALLSAAPKSA